MLIAVIDLQHHERDKLAVSSPSNVEDVTAAPTSPEAQVSFFITRRLDSNKAARDGKRHWRHPNNDWRAANRQPKDYSGWYARSRFCLPDLKSNV
jgi:hypothetical protein